MSSASEVTEIKQKLALISEVMADGYHWIYMSQLVESFQKKADLGDPLAHEMNKLINTFHKLCVVVKGDSTKLKVIVQNN